MRARTVVAALVLVAAVGAPAPAGAEVVVQVGGRTVAIGAERIAAEADVASADWGGPALGVRRDGLSFRKLVVLAGGDPDGVRALTAQAPTGELTLDGDDLGEPPPFGRGPAVPPVVWADDDGVHALRAAGDGTAAARLDAPAGAAVRVVVTGGERIAVTADVTPRRVAVGEEVRLVARADAAPPGARFRWHLGDGAHRDGRELTHRFRRAGRHEVFVTVTAGALSGASAARTVTVGAVPATPARQDERPASAGSAGPGEGRAGARRRGRGGAGARAGDGSSTGGAGRDGSAAPGGRAPAAPARPSAGRARGGGPTPAPDHRPGQRGGGPRAASRRDGAARSGPGTVSGTVLAGPDAAGPSGGAAAAPDASAARPASQDTVTGADATAVPTWRRPVVALGAALGLTVLAGVVAEARAGRGPDRRRRRWSVGRGPTTVGPR